MVGDQVTLEAEPNHSSTDPLRDLTGMAGGVGHVDTAGDSAGDRFTIDLTPGQTARIFVEALDLGGSTPSALDPSVELIDPNGQVVAFDADSGANGTDAYLEFTPTVAGTYTIRVLAENATAGDYLVRVGFVDPATTDPSVVEVVVSSRGWTNPAFLQVIDPGRGLGYSIPVGNGSQLAALPWSGLDQIHIVFSENVNVTQDDLLVNGADVAEYWIDGFAYDDTTFTATWTLLNAIDVDKVFVDVQDTITDTEGNALDGDWDNPTEPADSSSDTFASGDGEAGGDFEFRFNVVPGDTDRSGGVTNDDLAPMLFGLGQAIGGAGYNVLADIDGSGVITDADIDTAKLRIGQSLPTGEPVSTDIDTGVFEPDDGDGNGSDPGDEDPRGREWGQWRSQQVRGWWWHCEDGDREKGKGSSKRSEGLPSHVVVAARDDLSDLLGGRQGGGGRGRGHR